MVDQTPEGGISWYEDSSLAIEEERPWVQVWSRGGVLLYRSSAAESRPIPQSRMLAAIPDDNRIISVSLPGEPVPMRILTRRGSVVSKPVVIQVALSEAPLRDQVRDLTLIFVLGLPLAVSVAGLGGYALARGALKPVETMAERAREITADRLAERLPVANPDDEMGRLATVFNETLGRLQQSFEQMRQFTSDVSHELRTPLTSIRSVGEVGLRSRHDEQGYRGIIGSMLEEVDRLARRGHRTEAVTRGGQHVPGVGHPHYELLELGEVGLAAQPLAVFRHERLELGEHHHMFAVGVGEHLLVDGAVVDEGRGHVPVAAHHAEPSAVRARQGGHHLVDGRRVEVAREPVAGLAHGGFAAQFVQLEQQVGAIDG
jgi:signal transduction histidine kinase